MEFNSKQIQSNQPDVNKDLEILVKKHLSKPFKKPFRDFSESLFQQLDEIVKSIKLPVILDSGCGTGESSLLLAKQHPDYLVIGIDKSDKRLKKTTAGKDIFHNDNVILARGDVIDIWRLAKEAKWEIKKNYLLYPNPWPKKDQLKRRWHGHPVFPEMVCLCSQIELRTNWNIYAKEFKHALELATNKTVSLEALNIKDFISPFEKKYYESGHPIFRVMTT